mgnify:CR=1 FL=1
MSFAGSGLHGYLPAELSPTSDGVLPMREVSTLRSFTGAVVCGVQGDEVRLRVVPRDEAETLSDSPLRCVTGALTVAPTWLQYTNYAFSDGHTNPVCFERLRDAMEFADNADFGTAYLRVPTTVGRNCERITLDLPAYYSAGDMDGNGVVDVADVNVLINIILERQIETSVLIRADMTGDGTVDVSDLNALITLML